VAVGTGLAGALTGYLGYGGRLAVDAAAAGTGGATARTAPVRRRLTLTQIAVATFLLLVSALTSVAPHAPSRSIPWPRPRMPSWTRSVTGTV
jgi:hypothetical protein